MTPKYSTTTWEKIMLWFKENKLIVIGVIIGLAILWNLFGG